MVVLEIYFCLYCCGFCSGWLRLFWVWIWLICMVIVSLLVAYVVVLICKLMFLVYCYFECRLMLLWVWCFYLFGWFECVEFVMTDWLLNSVVYSWKRWFIDLVLVVYWCVGIYWLLWFFVAALVAHCAGFPVVCLFVIAALC